MQFIQILKEKGYKLRGLNNDQIKKIEMYYDISLPP